MPDGSTSPYAKGNEARHLIVTQEGTSISSGRKTVTTAGVPVKLTASATVAKRVEVSALESNTDMILVGGVNVVAGTANDAGGTRAGIPISAGQTLTIDIDDVSKIYIDAVVSGEGVSYTYFN